MNDGTIAAPGGQLRLSILRRLGRLLPGTILLGLFAAAPFAGPGLAQNSSAPSDLAGERKRYSEESAAALQPVQKRYTTRLKALQKLLEKRGDKAGVAAIESELGKMGTAMAQQMRYPIEGKRLVRYPSGNTRNYVIHADGNVQFVEENRVARFTKSGDEVVVDFGDDKLERFYWNTVLVVEHSNPKSDYGTSPPKLTGFAEKAE